MPNYKPETLISRFNQVKSDRSTLDSEFEAISRTVYPFRGEFFRKYQGNNTFDWRSHRNVYDMTAIQSAQRLAASTHHSMINAVLRWFSLSFLDPDMAKREGVAKWLEQTTLLVYNTLKDSNFGVQTQDVTQDLIGYGTAPLLQEDIFAGRDQLIGTKFTATALRETWYESDAEGYPLIYYNLFEWTPDQVRSMFPGANLTFLPQTDEAGGATTTKIEILFAVYRTDGLTHSEVRRQNVEEPERLTEYYDPAKRPVQSRWIHVATGTVLKRHGFYEMPATVAIWDKVPGSQWGFSPAMVALPSVLSLNALVQLGEHAILKSLDTPLMGTENALITDLDISPGSYNTVTDPDAIRPIPFNVSHLGEYQREADLRDMIRKAFYADTLEVPEIDRMSATEAQLRYDRLNESRGPIAARLQERMLKPIIERTFRSLLRARKIPELPQSLAGASIELDIKFTGPLTRAQAADQINVAERWLSSLERLSQTDAALGNPNPVWDWVNTDEVPAELLSMLSANPGLMASKADVDQKRKLRQEQQQRAQEREQEETDARMIQAVK